MKRWPSDLDWLKVAGLGRAPYQERVGRSGDGLGAVTEQMTIDFRAIDADREPARTLLAATLAEYQGIYGDVTLGEAPSAPAAEMTHPSGAFLVAYEGKTPVGCGGLKRMNAETVEVKRMYVVPAARGRGLGRAILDALEDEARRLGYVRVRLDTGPRQPRARALYESAG